eukprot:s1288_g4.t2
MACLYTSCGDKLAHAAVHAAARWPDGSKYDGTFESNNMSGTGTYNWSDGRAYTGQWERNTMHGKGSFSYGDGRSYEGDFFEDVKHGTGATTANGGTESVMAVAGIRQPATGQRLACLRTGTWSSGRTEVRADLPGVPLRFAYSGSPAAMRQAFRETSRPAVQSWLERRIGLASFDRSYYYTVDTKQKMFYSAITADLEAVRLREAGFDDVRIRICNIINFFDIKTKPKAARINAAVIRLLERGDVWGAQLLLSRGVALAFKKPLSSMRVGSSIFDASSEHKLYGQAILRPKFAILRQRPKLATALIPVCSQATQDPGYVLRVLQRGRVQLNIFHHNAAISCCRLWQWKQAADMFLSTTLHMADPNTVTYNTMLSALDVAGKWSLAAAVASSAAIALDVVSSNTVLSALSRGALWAAATCWLCNMRIRREPADSISFNSTLTAWGRRGLWTKALSLFAELRRTPLQAHAVTEGGHVAMLHAMEQKGQWQRAALRLNAAAEDGAWYRLRAVSATVSACEKGTAWQFAAAVVGDMTDSKGIRPDEVCISAMVSALENCSRCLAALRAALAAVSLMPAGGLGTDMVSCSSAISACENACRWTVASALLRCLASLSLLPSPITFNSITLTCARVALWQASLHLLRLLTPYSADQTSFNAALASLAPNGKWQQAAALVTDMMSQGELPDELSCDSAFSACARASQPLAAVAYLRTVQHFGESLLPRGENDIMTVASTVCDITVPPFCPPEGGALLHFNRTVQTPGQDLDLDLARDGDPRVQKAQISPSGSAQLLTVSAFVAHGAARSRPPPRRQGLPWACIAGPETSCRIMLQGCRAWRPRHTSSTGLRAAWRAHPLQVACRFGSQTAGAVKDPAWSHRAFLTLAGVGLGSAFAVNKESTTARSAEGKSQSLCVVGEAGVFLDLQKPPSATAWFSVRCITAMVDTSNVSKAHEELAEVHEVAKSLKCMTSVLDKQLGRLEAKCAQSLKGIIEDLNRCLQRLEEEVKQAISDRDPHSLPDAKGEHQISLPGVRHRSADADEDHKRSFDDSVQKERSLDDEQVMLSEGDTPSPKADDAGALVPFKTPREVCLVDPSWTSKLVWDIYVMLVVLMDAMVLPFQLSFKNSHDPDGFDDFWFWLTTMTFSADILASFNTAIPRGDDVDVDDAKETLIVERRIIAATYLRGWFVLDFISTVPWSRIVDTMVGPGGGPMVTVAKLAKVLKFIRIIRLMKMLRAKKLKDIWEQVEKRIGSVAIVQGMMLIRVLLVVVGICHWNACLFWIVGARESIVTDFMPTTLKDQFDRMPHWTTISRSDAPDLDPWTYERKPMFEQYIFCFYWTLGVMRTMPAEVTPVNAVERVFVLCFMFFALSAFAVSVASLTQAYFKISERGRSFNDEMFAIRMHLHKLRVEETSQRKIKEYLHHKFTRRRIMAKEANLLKELPSALKEEVENAKVLQQVHHLPCMQGLSKDALKQVCKSAEFLDILPGEHLVCAGDVTQCAWVVCSGTVKVEDVMGQKCVVDGDPPVINAECLLTQEPFRSPTTVTTTSTCELYKLEKTKFFEIAAHHLTKQPKMKRQQSGPTAINVEEATDRVTTPHASAGAAAAISAG